MTRKQFLINAGLALGGTAFGLLLSRRNSFSVFAAKPTSTKLIGVGINAPGSLPFLSHETPKSVVSVLDVTNGQKKHFYYNIADAHSLVDIIANDTHHHAQGPRYALISNHANILLLDENFQTKMKVDAPSGVDFGGHAVYIAESHMLVATLRQSRLATDQMASLNPGRLAWIDCTTARIVKLTDSGGFEPHDIQRTENKSIMVANYGNTTARGLTDYTETRPSLCEVDSASGDIIKVIACPSLGAVSHISLSDHELIGAIPAQLFPLGTKGLIEAQTTTGGKPIAISLAEQHEAKIGGSSPLLIYHMREERWRSILIDADLQRRAQSIHFHKSSQTWWMTFAFSDTVASCTTTGSMKFYSCFDWGISTPRGVTSIDDRIYVSGQERGIAEVDAHTGTLIARHDVTLFRSTHVSAHR